MLYSAKAAGFYDPRIHALLPDDSVEITESEHRELLDGQANGKQIVANAAGRPVLVDRSAANIPYDKIRREAILEAWPVHAQLEAITEQADNRPEKMTQLLADIAAIKEQYPKPVE